MNVNPNAKRILCFGDSNTYGETEGAIGRLPVNQRWTGKLQEILGSKYEVIEEGRSGRTTNMEDPEKPGRNGAEYLFPCLKSHVPLDWVILMLGTNDCKPVFKRNAAEISDAVGSLIKTIQATIRANVLIIGPVEINVNAPKIHDYFPDMLNLHSEEESQRLAENLDTLAKKLDCSFLDANSVAKVGPDGIHLTTKSHTSLAQAIAKVIA